MSNQYISREIYNENLKDKLTQSPFEKYQKYGRFPFKFIITCSLVFLTSLQVIFLTEYYSFNNAFQVQSWTFLLLDTDSPQNNVEQYHMIEEFKDSIQSTLDNLEQIDDITIQPTKLLGNVTLNINYNYPYDIFMQEKQFQYPVTLGENITEPFDINDAQSIKEFWMNAFAMTMKIENLQVYYGSKKMCWDVIIKYRLTDYGYIEARIDSSGGVCAFQTDDDDIPMVGNEIFQDAELGWDAALLQILIIVLSLTQMTLGFKYIFEVIQLYTTQIYQRQRKQRLIRLFRDKKLDTLKMIFHDQRPWDQLRFSEKLLFFDSFLPLTIIGNIFQLIASCVILIEGFFRVDELSDYDEVLGGFGCFFAWIALLKFLDYSDELHMTASVLEKSIIPLLMATLNFVPVFFGYTFLGMCIFSQTELFSSLSNSTTVLIALIYGDSISDVIRKSAKGVNIITSMLFTCSYILIFIFTVNNIMIALIKEQQDYKKNTLQREKEFENQLAVKNDQRLGQSIFGDLSNLSMTQKQFKQVSQNDIDEGKSDNTFSMISEPINSKKMTFKQAAQLQILIKKFPQVTQFDIDQDLSARNLQEKTINNLNCQLIYIIRQLKWLLGQIEQDFLNNISNQNQVKIDKEVKDYLETLKQRQKNLTEIYQNIRITKQVSK
ncbi:hypothetical protein pb186bvf_002950 [Paramecium bursaria]